MKSKKLKIGYVDEDSIQLKKYFRNLESDFDMTGYTFTKGMSLETLLNQIYESNVDLLLVDYLLAEKGVVDFNGDQVVREYEKWKPRFPMLIFTGYDNQAFPQVDNPNIIVDKELLEKKRNRFIDIVKKNVKVYRDYITERKKVIGELIEKGEKIGLDAKERSLLLEKQLELKGLDKKTVEMPYQLLNTEKIEKLSTVRKEAEAYLKKLIKKNKK